jgi:hypothetical protein
MTNNRTIIAACVAALLASTPVFAKDSSHFHEADWSKVKSYGNVSVSQDSVESWGAWTDFVEPAAGGPIVNPIQLLGAGSVDRYRNIPGTVTPPVNPPVDTGVCGAGDWCGYSVFTQSGENSRSRYNSDDDHGHHGSKKGYSGGLFALTLTAPDGSPGEGTASWRLASPETGSELANSGSPMWANFGGGDLSPEVWDTRTVKQWVAAHWEGQGRNRRWVSGHFERVTETYLKFSEGEQWNNTDNGLAHFMASDKSEDGYGFMKGFSDNLKANEATNAIDRTPFDWLGDRPFTDAIKAKDSQVAVGEYSRTVWAYTNGQDSERYPYESESTPTTTRGFYVAGLSTPQAYLDAQKAGDVVALYSGGSFDGNSQGHVAILVNFKPATWSGVWYGGDNKNAMNFMATGDVVGAKITSNAVASIPELNSSRVSYAGSVQGTFYGQQAATIGGLTNVSKSVNDQVINTQNAVFLVNKVASTSASPK